MAAFPPAALSSAAAGAAAGPPVMSPGAPGAPPLTGTAAVVLGEVMDLSRPLDCVAFDRLCSTMAHPAAPEFPIASQVLNAFRAHPEAWRRVDAILERCTDDHARVVAGGILADTVKYRWQILPPPQREGIRNFVVSRIVALSRDEASATANALLLKELDMILVAVLKQDWPHNWPRFIDELDAASRSGGELLCENNMRILRLLSEEVFDFAVDDVTSAKASRLQASLHAEFEKIFRLCEFVITYSRRPQLVTETLLALQKYVSWIPSHFTFETGMVRTIVSKFLPAAMFRNLTLSVLTEIALADTTSKYAGVHQETYGMVITEIAKVIPVEADIPTAVESGKRRGSQNEGILVHRLTMYLTSVFRLHLAHLDSSEALRPLVLHGMKYLLGATRVNDRELLKITTEFWRDFARDLFDAAAKSASSLAAPASLGVPMIGGAAAMSGAVSSPFGTPGTSIPALGVALSTPTPSSRIEMIQAALRGAMSAHPRVMLYRELLSALRNVALERMPKPEEVLVEEDPVTREIVRSFTRDTDSLALYDVMREMLVYLTNLDPLDVDNLALEKLKLQMDAAHWSWDKLNSLCWAIGSISGTMDAEHEKRFLVNVIRDLLSLVDLRTGKNNKAVVASNIMYVVGQYPRFLSSHWKFLKTVVYKLFEFMHETHPGVQDMACDTFLKIADRCRRSFVFTQQRESRTFVEELVTSVREVIERLEPHQVQVFYEAAGCMIAAHPNPPTQEALTESLLRLPYEAMDAIVERAKVSLDSLRDEMVCKDLTRVMAIYERVCRSVGGAVVRHLGTVFTTLLNLYRSYSGYVNAVAGTMGGVGVRSAESTAMNAVRRSILSLMQAFVRRCGNRGVLLSLFLPKLAETIVDDFATSPPAARPPEVLDVFQASAVVLKAEGGPMLAAVTPRLMRPAVELVARSMTDFPEMRASLYRMLQSISKSCPSALLAMEPVSQKLLLDTLLWGIKHPDATLAERACITLREFLRSLVAGEHVDPSHMQRFFESFFVGITQDVLFVLTDRMHKAQFTLHVELLRLLFDILTRRIVAGPIWDPAAMPQPPGMDNVTFIKAHLTRVLGAAFGNLQPGQLAAFTEGLCDMSRPMDAYRVLLRDFLVECLEFQPEQSAELWRAEMAAKQAAEYARRQNVPGLANVDIDGLSRVTGLAAAATAGGGIAAAAAVSLDEDDF